ncbi:hypothetical protein JCM8097_005054 [Rhodosporidiobolus ruineniae]
MRSFALLAASALVLAPTATLASTGDASDVAAAALNRRHKSGDAPHARLARQIKRSSAHPQKKRDSGASFSTSTSVALGSGSDALSTGALSGLSLPTGGLSGLTSLKGLSDGDLAQLKNLPASQPEGLPSSLLAELKDLPTGALGGSGGDGLGGLSVPTALPTNLLAGAGAREKRWATEWSTAWTWSWGGLGGAGSGGSSGATQDAGKAAAAAQTARKSCKSRPVGGQEQPTATQPAAGVQTSWSTTWVTQTQVPSSGGGSSSGGSGSSGSGSSGSSSGGSSSGGSSSSSGGSSSSSSSGSTNKAAGNTGAIVTTSTDMHNDLRSKHSASNLSWNTTLANAALTWAKNCRFEHGGGEELGAGENISAYTGGTNVTWGIDMWVEEDTLYDYSNPGYSDATGHFTQMVWKSTEQVGCAEVYCPSFYVNNAWQDNWWFTVCEYYPPGNIVGGNYFQENVLEN